jgi:hypothetical protein
VREDRQASLQRKKDRLKASILKGYKFSSFQSPILLKEEAKNSKTKMYGEPAKLFAEKPKRATLLPQNKSQLFTIQESVDQINNPNNAGQGALFGFAAELPDKDDHDPRYGSPLHKQMPNIQNVQSPQPCVSPSSLINNIYNNEMEGQSAPLFQNMRGYDMSSGSKSNMSVSGGFTKNHAQPLFQQ